MKTLSIIGSTGSIGTQALDIVRNRREDFSIIALSAGSNIDLLRSQIQEFKPKYISVLRHEDQAKLQEEFPSIQILKNIQEIAALDGVDVFLSAVVGIAALEANLIAMQHAKRVAVASKETLVAAGHLVNQYCKQYGSELIPVDSEHVAIHQCLNGQSQESIKEILLTSSGGPFRDLPIERFLEITLEAALKHPRWSMGSKITIDSSTLVNKGLEVIEAHTLFGINYSQIKVIIHPQSIVHSAVSFIDGNTIAQLSQTDMRVPIQYALDYPQKKQIHLQKDFDILEWSNLEFYAPDFQKFPALELAYEVGLQGDSYPAVYNAANELAVRRYLNGEIHYLDIYRIISERISKHQRIQNPNLNDILDLNQEIQELSSVK